MNIRCGGYQAVYDASKAFFGWKNKMQAAMSHVLPAEQLAKQHTKEVEPGTAKH